MSGWNILGRLILGVYVVVLAWSLYRIQYPPECGMSYHVNGPVPDIGHKSDRRGRDAMYKNYKEKCIMPHWYENRRVYIRIHLGFDRPYANPVWSSNTAIAVDKPFYEIIKLPIPRKLGKSTAQSSSSSSKTPLRAWIYFTFDKYGTVDESENRKNEVLYTVDLTTIMPLRDSNRVKERNLLTDFNVTQAESQSDNKEQNKSQDHDVLHWRFAKHPLIIRYGKLYRVLGSKTLTEVGHRLNIRRIAKRDVRDYRDTAQVYDPVLWLDDLALIRVLYTPVLANQTASVDVPREDASEQRLKVPAAKLDNLYDDSREPFFLNFQFQPSELIIFMMRRILSQSLKYAEKEQYVNDTDLDNFRFELSNDRIFRTIMLQLVTWVHLFLQYLAFSDDWRFYTGENRNFSGVSSTSLLFSIIRSIIMILYLSNEDTSYIVLILIAKDIFFEIWKLWKVIQKRSSTGTNISMSKDAHTDIRKNVAVEYDMEATRWAMYLLTPCAVAFSAYSLKNYTYTSWWSWIVSSLADFMYIFGFVAMIPQIYINYRLRSVAHLPQKAFMYKVFSTFIDDIWAFTMKMPLKHRLMTFRDDIILFYFIYQWWMYPTDWRRVNEYGFEYNIRTPSPHNTAIDSTVDATASTKPTSMCTSTSISETEIRESS